MDSPTINLDSDKKSRAFVFGNGESRRNLDVEFFKRYGTTIGCNAMYRDSRPDILVATDTGITSEIVNGDYIYDNTCYFKGWNLLPIEMAPVFAESMETEHVVNNVDPEKDDSLVVIGQHDQFDNESDRQWGGVTYLMGIDSERSKARDLKDIKCDVLYPETSQRESYEFVGPQAADLASKFVDNVYLIGFDLFRKGKESINNIYKGTKNYQPRDSHENPRLARSVIELCDVFHRNPKINFWRVGDISDAVPDPMHICLNLQWISFENFYQDHLKATERVKRGEQLLVSEKKIP